MARALPSICCFARSFLFQFAYQGMYILFTIRRLPLSCVITAFCRLSVTFNNTELSLNAKVNARDQGNADELLRIIDCTTDAPSYDANVSLNPNRSVVLRFRKTIPILSTFVGNVQVCCPAREV